MTVAELIEALRAMPQDAEVWMCAAEGGEAGAGVAYALETVEPTVHHPNGAVIIRDAPSSD